MTIIDWSDGWSLCRPFGLDITYVFEIGQSLNASKESFCVYLCPILTQSTIDGMYSRESSRGCGSIGDCDLDREDLIKYLEIVGFAAARVYVKLFPVVEVFWHRPLRAFFQKNWAG